MPSQNTGERCLKYALVLSSFAMNSVVILLLIIFDFSLRVRAFSAKIDAAEDCTGNESSFLWSHLL